MTRIPKWSRPKPLHVETGPVTTVKSVLFDALQSYLIIIIPSILILPRNSLPVLSIEGPPSLPTLPQLVFHASLKHFSSAPFLLDNTSIPKAGRQLEAGPGLRARFFGNRSIPLFSAHIASHSFIWKDAEEGAYFLASPYRPTLPSLRILFISNEEFRRAVRPSPPSL